jgi:AAA family ATP:ADP antiporter
MNEPKSPPAPEHEVPSERGAGPPDPRDLSPLERALRVVTDVRPGEGAPVVALTAALFLLLTSYYLLKVAREPLVLRSGAEVKAYAGVGQALIAIVVIQVYSAVASKIDRLQLVSGALVFFLTNLVAFAAAAGADLAIGVPFYLWVGIFNYMSIAQVWALSADIYTEEQGKRLFPMVGMGSAFGAVAGSYFAKLLLKPPLGLPPAGPPVLLSTSAVLLAVCVVLLRLAYRLKVGRDSAAAAPGAAPSKGEPAPSKAGGFGLIARDRYLLLIAALTLLLNWVNSNGEYMLDRTLVAGAGERAAALGVKPDVVIGRFRADFFLGVNVLGIVLQTFVVSRFFRRYGVRRAIFVMPLFSFAGSLGMLLVPALAVITAAKTAENGLDYSLQNTARRALFLPVSSEAKYKAQSAVDTFVVRFGDVLSALGVFVGTKLAFEVRHFAGLNLALVSCWLTAAYFLARRHRERSAEELRPCRAAPSPSRPSPSRWRPPAPPARKSRRPAPAPYRPPRPAPPRPRRPTPGAAPARPTRRPAPPPPRPRRSRATRAPTPPSPRPPRAARASAPPRCPRGASPSTTTAGPSRGPPRAKWRCGCRAWCSSRSTWSANTSCAGPWAPSPSPPSAAGGCRRSSTSSPSAPTKRAASCRPPCSTSACGRAWASTSSGTTPSPPATTCAFTAPPAASSSCTLAPPTACA